MRCSRCVLPEETPKIVFDAEGVCNYCSSYQTFESSGEDNLLRVLSGFRNKGKEYDCIVGFSGGRDSSFVLLKLVKDYGMRVLGVNYENPFTVPQAKQNIENIRRILNLDIISLRDRHQRHVKSFRSALKAWVERPSSALIPLLCLGCKPVWLDIFRTAKEHGIRCIVTGGNPFEIMSFKRELVGISRDDKPAKAFLKYVYSIGDMLQNRHYFAPDLILTGVQSYFFGAPYAVGLRMYGRGIKWVQLFDYVGWNERQVLSRIQSELDWRHPPELKSTWRFDCRVKHLVDFLYLKTLSMSDKDDFYAKMVREGQLTREEALNRLMDENEIHMEEIELLLRQAGMENSSVLKKIEAN